MGALTRVCPMLPHHTPPVQLSLQQPAFRAAFNLPSPAELQVREAAVFAGAALALRARSACPSLCDSCVINYRRR